MIGILSDRKAFKPVINPREVEILFDAPLEMFLKVFSFSSSSRISYIYRGLNYFCMVNAG